MNCCECAQTLRIIYPYVLMPYIKYTLYKETNHESELSP